MAVEHAKQARTERLRSLGISYPFWVFDVDEYAWPRKLDSLLPESYPAKLTGWYRWGWEYGTDLCRIDDPLPPHVRNTRPNVAASPIGTMLKRLQYDNSYPADTFSVVYESTEGPGEERKGLQSWSFDKADPGWVAEQKVVRLERTWDGVPFWDQKQNLDLFRGKGSSDISYGTCSLVHNDAEFLQASGARQKDEGENIRKAEFEVLHGTGTYLRGVVLPTRLHEERGLYITRGPDFNWNKAILLGTALENADWTDVEEYILGKRDGPLVL